MTINGTIARAAFLFVLTVISATFGWQQADQISGALNAIMLIGLLGLIGLSLLTAFKPQIALFTGPVYAIVMGFWALGDLVRLRAAVRRHRATGRVRDVLGLRGVPVPLRLAHSAKVTKKFVAVVMVATLGILLMYVAAIVLGLFGVEIGFINDPTPLGIAVQRGHLHRGRPQPVRGLPFHRAGCSSGRADVHVVVLRVRTAGDLDLAVPGDPAPAEQDPR